MTKVAIHQSQYIPWPPYFKKMASADVFVVMDNVQFQKNGVQNRNKVRDKQGAFWLTIPVTGHLSDSINEKMVSGKDWNRKHWKTLNTIYSNAPHWNLYADDLERIYDSNCSTVGEINRIFLDYLIRKLNIATKIVYLSELKVNALKSDLVLEICRKLGARSYISGLGAKAYLKEDIFSEAGVDIDYKESVFPVYSQFQGGFIQDLSILDMMFNVNPEKIAEYLW